MGEIEWLSLKRNAAVEVWGESGGPRGSPNALTAIVVCRLISFLLVERRRYV